MGRRPSWRKAQHDTIRAARFWATTQSVSCCYADNADLGNMMLGLHTDANQAKLFINQLQSSYKLRANWNSLWIKTNRNGASTQIYSEFKQIQMTRLDKNALNQTKLEMLNSTLLIKYFNFHQCALSCSWKRHESENMDLTRKMQQLKPQLCSSITTFLALSLPSSTSIPSMLSQLSAGPLLVSLLLLLLQNLRSSQDLVRQWFACAQTLDDSLLAELTAL